MAPASQGWAPAEEPLTASGAADGDHREAQYRAELFSYRLPEATELTALCSRLLSLTVSTCAGACEPVVRKQKTSITFKRKRYSPYYCGAESSYMGDQSLSWLAGWEWHSTLHRGDRSSPPTGAG